MLRAEVGVKDQMCENASAGRDCVPFSSGYSVGQQSASACWSFHQSKRRADFVTGKPFHKIGRLSLPPACRQAQSEKRSTNLDGSGL